MKRHTGTPLHRQGDRDRPTVSIARPATVDCAGILEIDPREGGRLRPLSMVLAQSASDPAVPRQMIAHHKLRPGVLLSGRATTGAGRRPEIREIERINNLSLPEWALLPEFSHLTPISPFQIIRLEGKGSPPAMRILDLFCPLGRGQRALIVSPPKAGKTILLQQLAHAISSNNTDIELAVLLIDERPEEVTDMRRSIRGEVFASSSDSERGTHVRLAQLVLEYARRKVETGTHVVLLLDSLTRLGRAFNLHQRGSGKTLSGGVDSRALEIPKRIFGAARAVEGGGSLTIIATALIETASRMDELIFQEFKGTGNMELVLDRELANERIFPAINMNASGTRREELLFGDDAALHQALRRSLARMSPRQAMIAIQKLFDRYPTNRQLLSALA